MASIKDVARKSGVSISTVSYVFTGKRSVKLETRIRVFEAARELGYFPNVGAQMLRNGRTHIIALSSPIHSYTNFTNYAAFFFEMVRAAHRHHFHVLLFAGEDEDEQFVRFADSNLVDGVVLLDVAWNDERIQRAKLASVPYVSIGMPMDSENLIAVDVDFEEVGRIAIDRLAESGHKEILFVGSDQSVDSKSKDVTESNYLHRITASIQAQARRRGITVHSVLTKGDDYSSVRCLLADTFDQHDEITGMITQTSIEFVNNAIGVLQLIGRPIPERTSIVSLASYGKTEMLPVQIDEMPLLPAAVCSKAMQLLIGALDGEAPRAGHIELLHPTYIDRGSIRRV
ncbi:MAG: LacI family DNA-binding transcriptional regulator [Bifidobacterium sp.]|uniref:LacI family DNA-binding transcriptional regulator n=1 Tax=Bifidobacterium sp. TaxID=41200 RepID=UPI0039EA5D25